MIFNVATLLHEPVGSVREYVIDSETVEVPDEDYSRVIDGRAHLLRTSRGLLLRAQFTMHPTLECSRCLDPFESTIEVDVEEMFVFERDPVTRQPVEVAPEEFRLVDDQYLDVSEAVRQYEQSALPISPLCRDGCAGLCPVCGRNRNREACDCVPEMEIAPALGSLAALADRLRSVETGENDGRSEA